MCLEQCATGNRDPIPNITSPSTPDYVRNNGKPHVNVLVTSGALIPSLVKCLLFRLDELISSENGKLLSLLIFWFQGNRYSYFTKLPVYSSWEVGKLQCFSLIKERFNGPNVKFCVIGDGWEECEAAETMRWPFVKVDPGPTSYHRFPGLTLRDLDLYFSVVYGDAVKKDDEE